MVLFGSKEDLILEQGEEKTKIKAYPTTECTLSLNKLYCTTDGDYRHYSQVIEQQAGEPIIFNIPIEKTVNELPNFPTSLHPLVGTEPREYGDLLDQLLRLSKASKKTIKLAVAGALGAGLGDTIVGLEMMRNVLEYLKTKGLEKISVDVLIRQRDYRRLRKLYTQFNFVNRVRTLPLSLDQFMHYDGYWDFSSLVSHSRFDTMPIQDFYINMFGIDPHSMNNSGKEPKGFATNPTSKKSVEFRLKDCNRPLLLFHPKSTTVLRDMPKSYIYKLLPSVLSKTEYTVISLLDIEFEHQRFYNLFKYSSTFDDYCAFIESVDAVLCVDTSAYHLAAGYRIPTLVLFSTIPPTLRLKYYSTVEGLLLPGAEQTAFFKNHVHSFESRYKARQIAECEKLWHQLDIDDVINRINKIAKSH